MNRQKDRIKAYRKNIIKILTVMTAVIILTEIGVYLYLKLSGRLAVSDHKYFLRYILIPSTMNILSVATAYLLDRNPKVTENIKNYAPVVACSIMSLSVAANHNFFITSLCSVCVPVTMVTVFGRARMIKNITILSFVMLILATIFARYDAQKDYVYIYIQAFIVGLILFTVYLFSMISLKMVKENYKEIEERIHKEQFLTEQLLKDHLTGLYNHTAFYRFLVEEMENAKKKKSPLCLAVIDIDDFKKVNDRFGHENGNLVLIRLAAYMKQYCQAPNIVCRYGGEEFTIIFPGLSAEEAKIKMEFIKDEIQMHNFSFMPSQNITISCGICSFSQEHILEADEFFKIADEIMYQAKNAGKNRVIAI